MSLGSSEQLGGSLYLAPEDLPDSSLTVLDFQDALAQGLPSVIEFDPILDTAEKTESQKTVTQLCVDGVKAALSKYGEGGLYVGSYAAAEEMAGMSEVRISRTSIGETSAHQVFFASLSDGHQSLRVAVKPFTEDPHKSIHEWANTLIARRRGLETFSPLGFILHGDQGYALSLRQDGIEPMDNADWSKALQDTDHNREMLVDLQKLGPAIARLHERGCFHGDIQLKNAVITERGSVHVIDWEAAKFIDRRNVKGEEQADFVYSKTVRDLKVLFGSLARPIQYQGVGMLDRLTPAAQWSFYKELVVDPYIDERLNLAQASSRPEVADELLLSLGAVEAELERYIKADELRKSLQRPR